MSFVGGGTDFRSFFSEHGGAVVTTAIDKWVRVIVHPRFEHDLRVAYSQTEIVNRLDDLQHDLVRETLRRTGLAHSLDVVTLSDVPSHGTGLGSSSAVTVGLLNAFYAYQGIRRSPIELAREAVEVEIDVLGKPIGEQDQYACAAGGFNLVTFGAATEAKVEPIIATDQTISELHRSLILFNTGITRSGDDVLARQDAAAARGETTATLCRMRDLAYLFAGALSDGDVASIGPILDENWELKRSLASGVSNADIDALYATAREAGASGGKLLGAGGGGFLLLLCPPAGQPRLRRALGQLKEFPICFAASGTQITHMERP